MDGLIARHVSHVDRVLLAACDLFPASDDAVLTGHVSVELPVPPSGNGGLAGGVEGSVSDYRARAATAGAVTAGLSATMRDAATTAMQGGRTAASIRQVAATEAAAITADGLRDPAAVVLLVSRLDERLDAMQAHIAATRAELQSMADHVAGHTNEYTDIP